MQPGAFIGGRIVKTYYTCEQMSADVFLQILVVVCNYILYLGSIEDNDLAIAQQNRTLVPGYLDCTKCTGGGEQPTVAVEGEVEPNVVLELEDGLGHRPRLRLRHGSLSLVGELKIYLRALTGSLGNSFIIY